MLSSGHHQEKSSPGVVLHGIIVIVLFPFLLSIQKELSAQSLMAAEPPEHISFPPPLAAEHTCWWAVCPSDTNAAAGALYQQTASARHGIQQRRADVHAVQHRNGGTEVK